MECLSRRTCLSWLILVCVVVSSSAVPRYANSWAVEVRGGTEVADRLAEKHGFINHGQIGNLRDHYHFCLAEFSKGPKQVIDVQSHKTAALTNEEQVGYVEQQAIRERVRKSYVPPSDPNWPDQWALLNTGQTNGPAGYDLNVERAWMQGVTGEGIVVSFVDDGLEKRHPDLRHNFDSTASWDFVDNDNNPTPDYSADNTGEPNSHGTSCAGEVGMARNNGVCGTGVAYNCNIGGLKIDFASGTDLAEANYLGYKTDYIHIKSNSWGPSDVGYLVDGPGPLLQKAMENAVREGRNGKGSLFTFAAGNGGGSYDSCAADGYTNSIYTISVGSADQNGRQADYDEDCSAKMVVTYSYNSDTFPTYEDDPDPYNQISTTTIHGLCEDGFTGTSASTPLVSGVLALTLQANPDLSWRDVQYLIAYTSNRDELQPHSAWITNGAGLRVSRKFGFGAIDAEAMVTRARRWISVPEQHSYNFAPTVPQGNRTAYRNNPFTFSFSISENDFNYSNRIGFLEHVVVQMTLSIHGYTESYDYDDYYNYLYEYYYGHQQGRRGVDSDFEYFGDPEALGLRKRDIYDWLANKHTKRGDIKVTLISPQGTLSVLLPYRKYDFVNEEGYDNWPFMSVHFWGEDPVGTWTLKVNFKSTSGNVKMSNFKVTVYGTAETPEAVSSIPSTCDSSCTGACSGPGPESCDSCSNFRDASTLRCTDECPSGTYGYRQYCFACDSEHMNSSMCLTQPSPTVSVEGTMHTAMSSLSVKPVMENSTTIPFHLASSSLLGISTPTDGIVASATSMVEPDTATSSAPIQSNPLVSTTDPPRSQLHTDTVELTSSVQLSISAISMTTQRNPHTWTNPSQRQSIPPASSTNLPTSHSLSSASSRSEQHSGTNSHSVLPLSVTISPSDARSTYLQSETLPPSPHSLSSASSRSEQHSGTNSHSVLPLSVTISPSDARSTYLQSETLPPSPHSRSMPVITATATPTTSLRYTARPSPTESQAGGGNHSDHQSHVEDIIAGVLVPLFVLLVVSLVTGVVIWVCCKRRKSTLIEFIPLSNTPDDEEADTPTV